MAGLILYFAWCGNDVVPILGRLASNRARGASGWKGSWFGSPFSDCETSSPATYRQATVGRRAGDSLRQERRIGPNYCRDSATYYSVLKERLGLLRCRSYTSPRVGYGTVLQLAHGEYVYLIGPVAASFALCLLALCTLRPVAVALDLIDRPGGRKSHIGDVPVIGGLGMLLGMVLGFGLLPAPDPTAGSLLAAFVILVTVGLIDDRFGLSPWVRLPVQMVAAVVIMAGTGVVIETIGTPFGSEEVRIEGISAYAFTGLVIVAAMNACNMLDGMDGLAGTLAMVALAALAFLVQDAGGAAPFAIVAVMMGAVAAFLVSNLPMGFNHHVRCFMGDSGSMLLGSAVAWACIALSQAPAPAAKPVTMLWIVALPMYELSWTVIRRTIRGISPFKPDTGHLHHLVLQAGFNVREAFALFIILAVLLASFGIAIDRLGVPDSWSYLLLVVAGVLVIRMLYWPNLLRKLIPGLVRQSRPAMSGPGGNDALEGAVASYTPENGTKTASKPKDMRP